MGGRGNWASMIEFSSRPNRSFLGVKPVELETLLL